MASAGHVVVSSRDSEVKPEKKEAEQFGFDAWPNCSSCTIWRLNFRCEVSSYASRLAQAMVWVNENLLSRGSRAHEHMKVGLHARLEVHKFRHVLSPLFNNCSSVEACVARLQSEHQHLHSRADLRLS